MNDYFLSGFITKLAKWGFVEGLQSWQKQKGLENIDYTKLDKKNILKDMTTLNNRIADWRNNNYINSLNDPIAGISLRQNKNIFGNLPENLLSIINNKFKSMNNNNVGIGYNSNQYSDLVNQGII